MSRKRRKRKQRDIISDYLKAQNHHVCETTLETVCSKMRTNIGQIWQFVKEIRFWSSSASNALWQTHRQRRHITPHRPRQSYKRHECEIVFAALDPTDIAAIEARFMRQSFLRQTQLTPAGANALAKNVEVWVHRAKSPQR